MANKVAFLYSFGNKQHNQYYPAIKTDNYHSHTLKAITDNSDFTKLSKNREATTVSTGNQTNISRYLTKTSPLIFKYKKNEGKKKKIKKKKKKI